MAVAGYPSSYQVPGGTSGPLTPNGQNLFAAQMAGGGSNAYGGPAYGYNSQAAQQIPGPYLQGAPGAPTPQFQAQEFMSPAIAQYVAQFQASQAAQQQAINAGLLQAMQGLGTRRDAAAKSVTALTPQVAATLGSELAAQANTQAVSSTGLRGPMVAPTVGGQTLANVVAAGAKETAATNKSSSADLQAGVAADYTKGKTTLSNQQMANQSEVARQQQAFDLQMMAMKAQFAQQQQGAKLAFEQRQWEMAQAKGQRNDDALRQHGWDIENRNWEAEQNRLGTAAQEKGSPALRPEYANVGLTQGQVQEAESNSGFQGLSQQITNAKDSELPRLLSQISDSLRGQPAMLTMLQILHPQAWANYEHKDWSLPKPKMQSTYQAPGPFGSQDPYGGYNSTVVS